MLEFLRKKTSHFDNRERIGSLFRSQTYSGRNRLVPVFRHQGNLRPVKK